MCIHASSFDCRAVCIISINFIALFCFGLLIASCLSAVHYALPREDLGCERRSSVTEVKTGFSVVMLAVAALLSRLLVVPLVPLPVSLCWPPWVWVLMLQPRLKRPLSRQQMPYSSQWMASSINKKRFMPRLASSLLPCLSRGNTAPPAHGQLVGHEKVYEVGGKRCSSDSKRAADFL